MGSGVETNGVVRPKGPYRKRTPVVADGPIMEPITKADAKARTEQLAAPTPQTESVFIPAFKLKVVEIPLRGQTPLIVHKFSEKARKQMEEKQQSVGGTKLKKMPKVPRDEFLGATYFIDEKKGVCGFPAFALKRAMVAACRYVDGLPMTVARGAFFVHADDAETGLLQIYGPAPTMRTDTVRLESGVADIRYRPQFTEWSIKPKIEFNPLTMSVQSVVNLLNIAGQAVGLGERRAERCGDTFGRFEVVLGK